MNRRPSSNGDAKTGPGGDVATHVTLWGAAATAAAAFHLLGARALDLGFSIFRWGWDSRDLVWKVPLGYVLVFAPIAVALTIAGLLFRRRAGLRFALWTWCTLVLFAFLLLFPAIHGYASLLLAGGVSVALSEWLGRHRSTTLRTARVVASVGTLATLALAVILPRARAMAESRALAALPLAPADAPNVLLLILDTVRADFMSLHGSDVPTTPNLERWSERATVFDESYATAPWTTPSHASLFTGQFLSIHLASQTRALAPSHRTLAEILAERGWATGGFTANYVAARYESGLAQGFSRYEDLKPSLEEVVKSTTITQADNVLLAWDALRVGRGRRVALRRFVNSDFTPHFTEQAHDDKSAEEVRLSLSAWLDEVGTARPFFAFVNFFDAHSPYRPPEPYMSMFGAGQRPIDRHLGAIRYIDDQIDLLLRDLERRGALDNTIVVVTADHGEQWGEHDLRAHGNSLYRQVIHVPLMIMYPRAVPAGVRVRRQVSGRDVPATVLDLARLPQDGAIGGASLASLWRDSTSRVSDVIAEVDQSPRDNVTFKNSYGPMKAIVTDSLHVIRDGRGLFEAYAYRRDRAEAVDLVAAAKDSVPYRAVLQEAVTRHRLEWPRALPRALRKSAPAEREP